MRPLYIAFCFATAMLVAGIAEAQTTDRNDIPVPTRRKRVKPIKHELSGGLRLNTDGWSVFLERGKVKEPDRSTDYYYDLRFWQLEFSEKKHRQETKRSNAIGNNADASQPYIYGKVNNFYTFKLGYGNRKKIAGRPQLNDEVEAKTVSVHWVYMGGLSVGLEKPYYIDATVSNNNVNEVKSITYTDTTEVAFLNQAGILGSSGFGAGLGETKIVPGVHGKTALHFDFAGSKKTKLAIETGIAVDIYSRAIQLMALQNDLPIFVNAYVSFQFGKRWPEKK